MPPRRDARGRAPTLGRFGDPSNHPDELNSAAGHSADQAAEEV